MSSTSELKTEELDDTGWPLTRRMACLISFIGQGPVDSDKDLNALQTRIADRILVLEGWRATLLAILSGAVSALSLPPVFASPVLLFTFPVLVWLLDGAVAPAGKSGFFRRLWPAFSIGWLFGFGYFLVGFWWVGKAFLVDAEEFIYLLPVAVIALPAGLALFWGCATAVARLTWDNGWIRLAGLACTFALFEWLRGTILSGLPWNNIGYGAMPVPVFMQTSGIVGLYGMAFLTVLIATFFGVGLAENRRLSWIAAALLAAHTAIGVVILSKAGDDTVAGVKLRIVQPNIKQSEKWDEANEADIMKRYMDLSNINSGPNAASAAAFTHIIWPESAFPFILTQRPDQLAAIGKMLSTRTSLITGAMRLEPAAPGSNEAKVYNSLYVIDSNGEIIEARDKVKLVPFGEFLPFQDLMERMGFQQLTRLRGGFEPGRVRSTVSVPQGPPFLPLICYEIIYSGAVAGEGEKAEWIVNLTNDAWFGLTAGPYQHAHQSQIRAVEEGLPLVRAANSGISMIVDPYGQILNSLALENQGVVDGKLPVRGPQTIFSRIGNKVVVLFICVIFLVLIGVCITSRK